SFEECVGVSGAGVGVQTGRNRQLWRRIRRHAGSQKPTGRLGLSASGNIEGSGQHSIFYRIYQRGKTRFKRYHGQGCRYDVKTIGTVEQGDEGDPGGGII